MAFYFKNSKERLSRKRSLGISLGRDSIRAIEFLARKGYLEVTNSFEKYYSEEFSTTGILAESRQLFAELFRKVKTKTLNISIPESVVYTTFLRIPKSPEKDIKYLVEMHLENHLKYDKNFFIITYNTLFKTEDHYYIKVAVFEKKIIDTLKDEVKISGGKMLSFEGELSAIGRAVVPNLNSSIKLIVNINRFGTDVGVFGYGSVLETTVIKEGNNYVADFVSKKCECDTNTSIKFLQKFGVTSRNEKREMHLAVLSGIAPILDAIKSTILHFHAEAGALGLPKKQIDEIYIVGDGANIPGLPEYLTREIRTKTMYANPWKNANLKDDVIPDMPVKEALKYTGAIGAGLADLRDN